MILLRNNFSHNIHIIRLVIFHVRKTDTVFVVIIRTFADMPVP